MSLCVYPSAHMTHVYMQSIECLRHAGTALRHLLTDVILTEPLAQCLAYNKIF